MASKTDEVLAELIRQIAWQSHCLEVLAKEVGSLNREIRLGAYKVSGGPARDGPPKAPKVEKPRPND